MPTARKIAQVAELEDRLTRCVIAIGLDYRGLKVAQLQALRRALREREASMEVRVVKNTLLRRAAEAAGKPAVAEVAHETTALLLGYEDVVTPPKAIAQYLREHRLEMVIHGGYAEGARLSATDVRALADVPSRPELMAKVAGGVLSPIAGIAGALAAVFREMAAMVEARAVQLEEQGA